MREKIKLERESARKQFTVNKYDKFSSSVKLFNENEYKNPVMQHRHIVNIVIDQLIKE
jgi:hypothetical protein